MRRLNMDRRVFLVAGMIVLVITQVLAEDYVFAGMTVGALFLGFPVARAIPRRRQ
jgi:hypothetical protein